jgi:hypothetical protein
MNKKINRFVYWVPRILSILFVLFLMLFSLDVFSEDLSFWATALGLFMHNIPALILLSLIIVSWNHELVGAIAFILAGILYIAWVLMNIITAGFEWYYLSWAVQISGIAFFIGVMFLVGWFKKRKIMRAA